MLGQGILGDDWGRLAGALLGLAGCSTATAVARPPCTTDGGIVSLFTATQWIGGLAAVDSGVVVGSFAGVEMVPLVGQPIGLTTDAAENGVLVVGGDIYYTTDDPPGGSASGLYSLPLQGGVPAPVASVPDLVAGGPQATDGTSLYLAGFEGIDVLTPGAGSFAISLGAPYQINGIAMDNGWIYVSATDPSQGPVSLTNGVILRVPAGGGAVQKLFAGIGHPFALAAGRAGLFWTEASTSQPFYSGVGSIRRANLDGSSPTTLLPIGASSLALSGDTLLYGDADGTVGAIASDGSDPITLATGLSAPQVLVAGGNIVWLSPGGGEPLSGGPPQVVATTCIP